MPGVSGGILKNSKSKKITLKKKVLIFLAYVTSRVSMDNVSQFINISFFNPSSNDYILFVFINSFNLELDEHISRRSCSPVTSDSEIERNGR